MANPYIVAPSPHWTEPATTPWIMRHVVYALLPALVWASLAYGHQALLVAAACVGAAMLTEAACQRLMRRPVTVGDGSAAVTGLLLAMTLPANIPLWFAALGSAFAVGIAKQAFGGLGSNIWNPALLARAAMQVSRPEALISKRWPWLPVVDGETGTWTWASLPGRWASNFVRAFSGSFDEINAKATSAVDVVTRATSDAATDVPLPNPVSDILTGATPMTQIHFPPAEAGLDVPSVLTPSWIDVARTWIGGEGGSLGEVSAVLLLLGGVYLLARRIITWEIPAAYAAMTVFCVYALPTPVVGGAGTGSETIRYLWTGSLPLALFHLGGGGLMLGALFMATDYVTSPLTRRGKLIFGAGCGFLTMIIRLYGGYPEGVCYAILLMNTAVPLIDLWTRPRVFGTIKKKKGA